MPLVAEDLHYRHFQSVNDGSVQVFVCLQGTTPDGSTIDGPLIDQNVQLTPEEAAAAQAIIDRAKAVILTRMNAQP